VVHEDGDGEDEANDFMEVGNAPTFNQQAAQPAKDMRRNKTAEPECRENRDGPRALSQDALRE